MTSLAFTLQYWCGWQAVETSASNCWPDGELLPANAGRADVGFLPMLQSRRLSPLARAACAVAWRCRQHSGDMTSVFHSDHGESHYYVEILRNLAVGDSVSPSRFSLSVHNAIAGLSSFHSDSHQPYVALAGGDDGAFAAFIEAAGVLLEDSTVLVVCYEQALPEVYQSYQPSPEHTWALAMVLARAGGSGRQLRLTRESVRDELATQLAGQTLLQSILTGRRAALCRLPRSVWHWSLNDA